MTPFKLQIITPDRVFFDGTTDNVIVRTTVGEKGILASHEPYVAALTIGRLRVRVDGEFKVAAISSGTIKVDKDKTVILADSCEWGDEIDLERAMLAKKLAEEKLSDASLSGTQLDIAEFKLKRALNRIDVGSNRK